MRLIELTNQDTNDMIHINPEYIVAMFYEQEFPGLTIVLVSGGSVAVKESTVEVIRKINGETDESK